MKATIVSDSSTLINRIKQAIDYLFGNIEAENLVIVDLNLIIDSDDKRTQHLGLGVAKKAAKDPKKIIILVSFESPAWLMHNEPEFAGLMSLPNVGFADAADLRKIWEVYRTLSFEPQIDNLVGRQIYEFEKRQRLLTRLRHDLGSAQFHHHKLQLVLNEARERLGFTGNDIEVTDKILSSLDVSTGPFAAQFLSGIFVDAFETLFNSQWRLNQSVKAAIIRLAVDQGRAVIVISDSDDQFIKNKLISHEVDWQFISKYALRGAELEIVVDNLTKLEFEAIYGISTRQFINVLDL